MSFYFHRIMASQSNNAQRDEGTAESRPLVEVSQARNAYTPTPPMTGTPSFELRSRSKDYKELRQLGAKDFEGTTDPAKAEIWLKRTERVFTQMRCSREDQLNFIVSLL